MIASQVEGNTPVLIGKSIHNQRIERHNRALNEQVISVFKNEFYQLESEGVLDVNNESDIFCLHYVYFKQFLNLLLIIVTVSTEGNYTPEQLFWGNLHLSERQHDHQPEHQLQPNIEQLVDSDLPHAIVPDIPNPLSESVMEGLEELLRSLSDRGMDMCKRVAAFVGQNMLQDFCVHP